MMMMLSLLKRMGSLSSLKFTTCAIEIPASLQPVSPTSIDRMGNYLGPIMETL